MSTAFYDAVSVTIPFHYPTLDLKKSDIRVLKILPAQRDGLVRCTLSVVPLTTRHIALSYVWGSDKRCHKIRVNGQRFFVRKNVYDFLCHSTGTLKDCKIWIDAIRLNQSDDNERNHQVRRMTEIYRSAECVLVWLGWEDPSLTQLFEVCSLFSHDTRPQHIARLTSNRLTRLCQAYDLLCSHVYWTRLWIVPEVLSAQKIVLSYGIHRLPWAGLEVIGSYCRAWKRRDRFAAPITTCSMDTMMGDVKRSNQNEARGLQGLLRRCGMKTCSDPRDRVFALLGLAEDIDGSWVEYRYNRQALYTVLLLKALTKNWNISEFAQLLSQMLGLDPVRCGADARVFVIPSTNISVQEVPEYEVERWARTYLRRLVRGGLKLSRNDKLSVLCIEHSGKLCRHYLVRDFPPTNAEVQARVKFDVSLESTKFLVETVEPRPMMFWGDDHLAIAAASIPAMLAWSPMLDSLEWLRCSWTQDPVLDSNMYVSSVKLGPEDLTI